MRGFAAIAIVFIHMNGIIRLYGMRGENLFASTEMANAGVDVFFVISGLIMAFITHNKASTELKTSDFFIKRVTRIYPIYWIYLILLLIGNALTQGSLPETMSNPGLGTLLQSFTLLPSHELPVLIIAWTLKFEIFFYIVFTLLIASGKHLEKHYLYLFSIVMVVLGSILNPQQAILKLMTDPLLLEFTIGVFIGTLYLKKQKLNPVLFLSISVILIILELTGYSLAEIFNMYGTRFGRLVRFGLPASFIVTGFLFANDWISKYSPRILSRIGDASYSLYLSHILVLSLAAKVWSLLHLSTYLYDPVFAVYLTLVCLAWSLISYRYLEQPLIRLSRKYLPIMKY